MNGIVQLRRAALRRVLPSALRYTAPAINAAMRRGSGSSVKEWFWEHILLPYTYSSRGTPQLIRTSFGAYFVGTTTDFLFRHLATFGVFEPNATDWISEQLRPGDVFVDVGANIGYYTLLAAERVGANGRVVALEPLPPAAAALRRNLEINETTNVRTVPLAAYDRETTLTIRYRSPDDTGGASTEWVGDRPYAAEIGAEPLSRILTRDEISRARLIKIDVEGAEVAVLQGSLSILGDLPPQAELVIEVSETTYPLITSMLAPFGFHAFALENPFSLSDRQARRGRRPTRLSPGAPLPPSREPVWYVIFSRRHEQGI